MKRKIHLRRLRITALAMLALGLFSSNLFAQKPWKGEKNVAEWSQEELLLLLNDSPWTRKINLWQITGRRIAVFPDGSTALYQESPSSPPIQYSPAPIRIEPERMQAVYAVRWSSASIVTETFERLKKNSSVLAGLQAPPPELSPAHYVLTVRVVKPPTLSAGDRLSRATVLDENGNPTINIETEKNDILAGWNEEELLKASELRTNRKLRLKPDKVLRHGKGAGEGVSFFFPRQTNGQPLLSPKTKWVEFRFKGKLGNQLKARFKLKEMQIGGLPVY